MMKDIEFHLILNKAEKRTRSSSSNFGEKHKSDVSQNVGGNLINYLSRIYGGYTPTIWFFKINIVPKRF